MVVGSLKNKRVYNKEKEKMLKWFLEYMRMYQITEVIIHNYEMH